MDLEEVFCVEGGVKYYHSTFYLFNYVCPIFVAIYALKIVIKNTIFNWHILNTNLKL